jgi:hypothetical protein
MSRFPPLRAGIVVLCVAIVMAAGVIATVVAHAPLIVRATVMMLMAVCLLAGSGLVAMGASKIVIYARELRLLAQDHARAGRDAERD